MIYDYLQSISYYITVLEETLDSINSSYGREALNLDANSKQRAYLLYKIFEYILHKNISTYIFGSHYTNENKYQDMAKSFGYRLVYPFVTEIDEYIKDIATDMAFDDVNKYNINKNCFSVQVNIAEHGGTVHAEQENALRVEELENTIKKVSNIIDNLDNQEWKSILIQNLDTIKSEIQEKKPKKLSINSCLNTMKFIASSVAMIPDLSSGIQMIATLLGITI